VGRQVSNYPWSGSVVATRLFFLREHRQIELMKSSHDELAAHLSAHRHSTVFIFDEGYKQAIAALASEKFSEQELGDYLNDFNETDEPEAGAPMLDGVRFLRESLGHLGAENVIILSIG
jgi:hypothetical protein